MGILDDAIRQHLDLKRQRGATESELKQLEDEAFGPPARPGEPEFGEAEDSSEHSGNGAAAEAAVAEAEPAPEPDGSEDLTTVYDPMSEGEPEVDLGQSEQPEPAESVSAEAPVESLDTVEHAMPEEEVAPEPEEEAPEPEEEAPSEGDDEPAPEAEEHPEPPLDPERAADAQTGPPRDDVLADTPDFLRDAPEDDELWFEQGEPKDFDF
jgi:hypothetical protein